MKMPTAVIKEFKTDQNMFVRERVAKRPGILKSVRQKNPLHNIFCLRIDADEYEKVSFSRYKNLFKKYKDAVTIFFNVNSFKGAVPEIKECGGMALDVQSHAFYHHTYNDYASNRYNIRKAKDFFSGLGILTKGFASPMGKWNWPLMKALEDEGYEYSSDFSYDYLGLPSHPVRFGQRSSVLEIPIFPVAPELFYQDGGFKKEEVIIYYKKAIDEMQACGLPVIIYAHTSVQYDQIPVVLEDLAEYATNKGLVYKNMSDIAAIWKNGSVQSGAEAVLKIPSPGYIGKEVSSSLYASIKDRIKKYFDFERITPPDELKGPFIRRLFKRFLRHIL